MTDHDKERLFLQYRFVARSVAQRFCARYGRPFEETLDHAEFALAIFIYTSLTYNSSKASLETWLGVKVHWHLQEVYTKGRHPHCSDVRERWADRREISCSDKIAEWESGENPHCPPSFTTHPNWLQNLMEEVGEEGAALLHIIADAPHDLMAEIASQRGRTQEKRRANLMAYLVDVMDWPHCRVRKAFAEVEMCLSR